MEESTTVPILFYSTVQSICMVNAKKKGDRNERKAKEDLEAAGWTVETPNATPYPQPHGVDFFGCFDFMAVREGRVLFGQVKSNGPDGITSFAEKCLKMNIPFDIVDVEYWTFYDYNGWRIDEITPDGYETVVDERDSDEMRTDAIEYKKA